MRRPSAGSSAPNSRRSPIEPRRAARWRPCSPTGPPRRPTGLSALTAAALVTAADLGGPGADAVESAAASLRERAAADDEVGALSVQARLSAGAPHHRPGRVRVPAHEPRPHVGSVPAANPCRMGVHHRGDHPRRRRRRMDGAPRPRGQVIALLTAVAAAGVVVSSLRRPPRPERLAQLTPGARRLPRRSPIERIGSQLHLAVGARSSPIARPPPRPRGHGRDRRAPGRARTGRDRRRRVGTGPPMEATPPAPSRATHLPGRPRPARSHRPARPDHRRRAHGSRVPCGGRPVGARVPSS